MHWPPRHSLSRGTTGSRGIQIRSEAGNPAEGHTARRIRRKTVQAGRSGPETGRGFAYARRKGEHGSAILESFLAMILLGMILFGILQLFQLALADLVTDYAAFRGARSASVGFKKFYTDREVFVKAAPVSGHMIEPDPRSYPDWNRTESEKAQLEDYMNAEPHRIEYAYWNCGDTDYHTNYYCPQYGQPLYGGESCQYCTGSIVQTGKNRTKATKKTKINTVLVPDVSEVTFSMTFHNYPLDIPLHDWLTGEEYIDITGEASLTNHSSAFLE